MRFETVLADTAAPLARRNPTAKLAAALVLLVAVFTTRDPLTPTLLLAVELAVVPLFGLSYGALVRRSWPLLLGVAGIMLAQLMFAADRSTAIASGIAIGLRLLAGAVPGVLVFASTDPTDLADSLVQNAKASARFAYGTLAAWRLLPLLAADWEMLTMARRARGVAGGRNPFAHLRLFASTLFGLLVGAIRRATRLATAMDARGFDAGVPRTIARPQRFRRADAALVVGATLVGAAVIAISVWLGIFEPLVG